MAIDSFTGQYRWLSNFHLSPVVLDDEIYPSVEHAYQAAKTLDTTWRASVRKTPGPGDAKRLGRRVPIRADWESVKDGIMLYLLRQKFNSGSLRDKLIATGDVKLIEGNHWGDIYWGVCRGIGKNKLGELLMKVRSELT